MKTTVQVTIQNIALELEGFFTPEERQTREHPGSAAEFEVKSVRIVNATDDIYDLLVTAISMEDIADAACKELCEMENSDEYWGGY